MIHDSNRIKVGIVVKRHSSPGKTVKNILEQFGRNLSNTNGEIVVQKCNMKIHKCFLLLWDLIIIADRPPNTISE